MLILYPAYTPHVTEELLHFSSASLSLLAVPRMGRDVRASSSTPPV